MIVHRAADKGHTGLEGVYRFVEGESLLLPDNDLPVGKDSLDPVVRLVAEELPDCSTRIDLMFGEEIVKEQETSLGNPWPKVANRVDSWSIVVDIEHDEAEADIVGKLTEDVRDPADKCLIIVAAETPQVHVIVEDVDPPYAHVEIGPTVELTRLFRALETVYCIDRFALGKSQWNEVSEVVPVPDSDLAECSRHILDELSELLDVVLVPVTGFSEEATQCDLLLDRDRIGSKSPRGS